MSKSENVIVQCILAIYITVACLLFGLLRLYMASMVKEFPDGRKTKEIIQTAIALISPRSSVNTAYFQCGR